MSQALSTIHSISSLITTSSSTSSSKPSRSPSPCLSVQMSSSPQNVSLDAPTSNTLSPVSRRNSLALGIASAVLGLSDGEKNNNAWAAARRPPATPTDQEKKDPNISGVQAKVLASKKRKEAMKQAMEIQRERGKKIDESSNKKTQESSSKKFEEELPEKKIEESSP